MTPFGPAQSKEAHLFAEQGGQALHRTRGGRTILIDHDSDRLYSTARRLGVRGHIQFERPGMPGQRIELGGVALDRAEQECRQMELAQ